MGQMKVIVIGAGGKLGRRLVSRGLAQGHQVTAYVRNPSRLSAELARPRIPNLQVLTGDAFDTEALSAALRDQDVAINAAGNVADGPVFSDLFQSVLETVERSLPSPKRFWALGGAAVLTIPYADRIGVGLPFVPDLYLPHERNWKALEASAADWSFMCPGPMIPAVGGAVRSDLRVNKDTVPYHVPRWAAWVPKIGLSLLMKAKLPELIVSYEDVANVIMANLPPNGPFSRRRVGIALPAGERGRKENWTLGQPERG